MTATASPHAFSAATGAEHLDFFPRLIQAGMGVRISGAKLANATARLGALGVISAVGLRHIVTDEVRAGDEEAIDIARTFPLEQYVEDLLAYAPGGRKNACPPPMDSLDPDKCDLPRRLSAICAYIEVKRAKAGHRGPIGMNVMWKCALTVLPSIYGGMLAGVDALLCGAGVPMELPDIVRRMRAGEDLEYSPLHGTDTHVSMSISRDNAPAALADIPVPRLIPILSNYAFPKRILDIWARDYGVRPFAFVLENHRAGGHNAPPRNKVEFGEADDVNAYFDRVRDLGVPVYVAGAGSSRNDFLRWIDRGAYGLQVGSRFALSRESGMRDDLRLAVIGQNQGAFTAVETSNRLSSTGYPFKFVPLPGTLSEKRVYDARKRVCNKGYLVQSHFAEAADGRLVESYICSAMPVKQYVSLGGNAEDAEGRVCLCNALTATAGIGDRGEPPLVTLGVTGSCVDADLSAREVIEDILTPYYVTTMARRLAIPSSAKGAAASNMLR